MALARFLAAVLLACQVAGAAAEPFRPTDRSLVLERLPVTAGDPRAQRTRALRERLARHPENVDAAVALASHYFELASAEGDPRYIGYAESALGAWPDDAAAPSEILLLRGMLRQWRHEFPEALRAFDAILSADPADARALGWRAAVRTVLADYDGAQRDCLGLRQEASLIVASSCSAYVEGLTGAAARAERNLLELLRRHPQALAEQKLWLRTRLADLAARLGRPAEAEHHYREALALGITSQYLLANYTDFLLDQARHAEVVSLLAGWVRSDILLLRLTLAEKALGAPGFAEHAQALRDRFAAAAQRGDTLHRQDESRFRLLVEGDVARALELAVANWKTQREPYDARILLEAARAARRVDAAQPVLEWLLRSRHENLRLSALAADLRRGAP